MSSATKTDPLVGSSAAFTRGRWSGLGGWCPEPGLALFTHAVTVALDDDGVAVVQLTQGGWPGYPKLGYLRDARTKLLVPDSERFDLVHELWRMVLAGRTGAHAFHRARNIMRLRTPEYGAHGGELVSKSTVYKILHDPFYSGVMVRDGVTYQGTHPPMVTEAEFNQVQASISS